MAIENQEAILKALRDSHGSFDDVDLNSFWNDLLQLLHDEGADPQELLKHYFFRGNDYDQGTIVDVVQRYADLEDNAWEDILDTNATKNFWNKTVSDAIAHYVKNFKASANTAIPGTNDQITYGSIWNSNAGYTFVKEKAQNNENWVIPWKNIDTATYKAVRGSDKIVTDVLDNKGDLQFTHTNPQPGTMPSKKWIRLLMPMYTRHVEIEDLDRNFWVIGQVISGISAYLFDDNSPITTAIENLLREITELWENILYLWAALAMLNRKEYTDVHKEVIYLPVDEYRPYLKYDGIRLNTPNWGEICKRCSSYIQDYPESNLVLLIAKRRGVYYHNYYSTELYSGLLLYNRNNPNTQANTYGFSIVTFGDEDCDENFQSAHISLGTEINGNTTYGDCVYAIREDNNKYIYCAPYSDVPNKEALNRMTLYGLLRTIPSFDAVYSEQNRRIEVTNFKLSVYDAASRAIGQGVKLISELTPQNPDTPIVSVTGNKQTRPLVTTKKIIALPSCDISEIAIGAQNVSGYYQGELVSNKKTTGIVNYSIKETQVKMPPITTNDTGDTTTGRSPHKTFYYDVKKASGNIAKENSDILQQYKDKIMKKDSSTIRLLVANREFDLFKMEATSDTKKRELSVYATSRNGLGGYYANKPSTSELYVRYWKEGMDSGTYDLNEHNSATTQNLTYFNPTIDNNQNALKYEENYPNNPYLLPFCVYTEIDVENGTYEPSYRHKSKNAYYSDNQLNNYNEIKFTGSHGGQYDKGAILVMPGVDFTYSYPKYENYKVLPNPIISEEDDENEDGAYIFWIETDPSDGRTRHTWNDTTTMIFKKADDETITADNWCIIYIKAYGIYGGTGGLNTVAKVEGVPALKGYLNAPNVSPSGEVTPSGNTTDLTPTIFKVMVHVFMPNKKYEWSAIDMWYCENTSSRPTGKNDNFNWNPAMSHAKTKSANFDLYENLIGLSMNENGTIDGVPYKKIGWTSSYTEYDSNKNRTSHQTTDGGHDFYNHPHKGQ